MIYKSLSIPGNGASYIHDEFYADSTDRSCLSKSFHIRAEGIILSSNANSTGFGYGPSTIDDDDDDDHENSSFRLTWDLHPKKSSFRILLVRHAQSEDRSQLIHKADHAIDITSEGRNQAREAGKFINKFFDKQRHVRMWVSPYLRTRETAKLILEEASEVISDVKEHIFLGDQQFGLFEGIPATKVPFLRLRNSDRRVGDDVSERVSALQEMRKFRWQVLVSNAIVSATLKRLG